MFEVGDEVLCVRNRWVENLLSVGEMYTITDTCKTSTCVTVSQVGAELGVWFQSIRFIPNTPEAKAKFMRKKLEEKEDL